MNKLEIEVKQATLLGDLPEAAYIKLYNARAVIYDAKTDEWVEGPFELVIRALGDRDPDNLPGAILMSVNGMKLVFSIQPLPAAI